jgi:hypothetical protein
VNQHLLLRLSKHYAKAGKSAEAAEAADMVLNTLRRMAKGGIYDHLGGGFSRYSEDERWHVPHFEKMLYDNAQLALNYVEAYQLSGDEGFATVARGILDYVLRDLRSPQGGFYSAEDADSLPPGAKYQRVNEMRQDGYLDMAEARRLMDMPDIQAEDDLGNAAIDDVDAVIGKILDDDKPTLLPPEPYQNLQLLLTRANASYLFARHHGCEEDRLQMLRDLMDMASKMITPPPQPTTPTPGAMAAPSMAAPSPLLTGGINVDVQTGSSPQPVAPPVTG